MNILPIVLGLWLMSTLGGCAQNTAVYRLGDSPTAEDRRLLVTFADQSINRSLSANPQDGYRALDQYSNSGWSRHFAVELADRHHLQMITQWPVTELGLSCVVYEVSDQARLKQAIRDLENNSELVSVQRMNNFKVLAEGSVSAQSQKDPYLSLQSGYRSLGISSLHAIATGRGVRIALIDSGVDVAHPDLQGQIKFSQNLATEPADHNLADVHGTAVAGVLVAKLDNGIGIAGIAPHAEVFALRACWPNQPGALAAQCNSFTLALALNQAIRLDSQIINLSISGPDDPLLSLLIDRALLKDIIVIAAVPGKDQSGGFPANMEGVIAVGRGVENHSAQIIAPGQDILTTVPHQAYDFMTGSSFATPHVAGITALLLQLHPDWKIADIRRLLADGLEQVSPHLLDETDGFRTGSTTLAVCPPSQDDCKRR